MAKRKSDGGYLGGSTLIKVRPEDLYDIIRPNEIKDLKAEMKMRYGHMSKKEFVKEFPKNCPSFAPTRERAAQMYDFIFG